MSHILVYDLGGTKCDAAVFNEAGELLEKERIFTKAAAGHNVVIDQLLNLSEKLKAKYIFKAFVVGVPGMVSLNQTTVIKAPNINGFQNINLKEIFAKKNPDIEIIVENDANLFTFGEYANCQHSCQSLVAITLGTGIGTGTVMNKKLVYGEFGFAGEFGHMVIDYNGLPCNCGQNGCWERYASASSLIERIKNVLTNHPETKTSLSLDNLYMDKIKDAVIQKDVFAIKMLKESAFFIAIGLANIIKVIDPGVIVIGGSLGSLLDYYKKDLIKEINKRLLGEVIQSKIIEASRPNSILEGGFALYQSKQN